MSHAVDSWCKTHVGSARAQVNSHPPLTYLEADDIYKNLKVDASGYFYSAMISIADACNGLRCSYYSWATCKLYYSLFYSVRGLLALRRRGLVYIESRPYLVEATPSTNIRQLSGVEARGGTHGAILNLFRRSAPSHILESQPIDGCNALTWLKERREEVTYGHARYLDPSNPCWFSFAYRNGIRKVINAYTSSDAKLYAFDPDHAVLALPILAANCLSCEFLEEKAPALNNTDTQSIMSMFADEYGIISSAKKIFNAKFY